MEYQQGITKITPLIAQLVTQGQWKNGVPIEFGKLCFDSRLLEKDQVFIAIESERDGHEFVKDAYEKGASAAIVERKVDCAIPQLVVSDSQTALFDLAHWWRAFYKGELVLVTGSNGKSTTKEMLYSIFTVFVGKENCIASQLNFNNQIGLPLMLLELTANQSFAVIEAGMSHTGEIAKLTRLARPTMAVITNVGRAHMGNFEKEEDIAYAKGEIIKELQDGAPVVLNADDEYFPLWRSMAKDNEVIAFSHEGRNCAVCRRIKDRDFLFNFDGSYNHLEVSLQVSGAHNQQNALAAATVAWRLGIPITKIIEGLEKFAGVPGRLEVNMRNDLVVINDTYNASPESFHAAIMDLQDRPEECKVLVMGDMLELGKNSKQIHVDVINEAFLSGVDKVLLYGENSVAAAAEAGGDVFSNKKDLLTAARAYIHGSCAVLVKGSHGMHMEDVATALLEG